MTLETVLQYTHYINDNIVDSIAIYSYIKYKITKWTMMQRRASRQERVRDGAEREAYDEQGYV